MEKRTGVRFPASHLNLSPASKSRYGWKIATATLILKTTNQPNLWTLLFQLASVWHPCTLISSWNFVSCVPGLLTLSPASLNMRARATLRGRRGRAVTPYIYILKMTNNKSIPTPDVISVKYYIIGPFCHLCFIDFPSAHVFVIWGEFYCYKVTSGNLPLVRHNY